MSRIAMPEHASRKVVMLIADMVPIHRWLHICGVNILPLSHVAPPLPFIYTLLVVVFSLPMVSGLLTACPNNGPDLLRSITSRRHWLKLV
jgi:hypothetical protein